MGANSRARSLSLILAIGFVLAGCASGPRFGDNRHGRYKVGQPHYTVAPYQVGGVWYYPKVDYHYDETGTASWYGPGFDRQPTANGEIYDMNQLTAAHKTLPLPSIVEVTNLQNGRALRLRVNDRGPFVGDRLIDVSRRSAQLLGFETVGTAPVRVRVLKDASIQVAEAAMHGKLAPIAVAQAAPVVRMAPAAAAPRFAPLPATQVADEPPSLQAEEVVAGPIPTKAEPPETAPPREPAPASRPTLAAASHRFWLPLIAPAHAETLHARFAPAPAPAPAQDRGRIFVQAGTFVVPANARRVRARIAALGRAEIVPARVHGAALYRVRLGPVASEADARRLLREVADRGYPGARVVGE